MFIIIVCVEYYTFYNEAVDSRRAVVRLEFKRAVHTANGQCMRQEYQWRLPLCLRVFHFSFFILSLSLSVSFKSLTHSLTDSICFPSSHRVSSALLFVLWPNEACCHKTFAVNPTMTTQQQQQQQKYAKTTTRPLMDIKK